MRVSVVGSSGAGKTTFGRELASRLGVSFVELDATFHPPDWTQLPDDEFCRRVGDLVRAESWVGDGNYAVVRTIMLGRATDVVWLDLPKSVVVAQVTWRSLARAVTRRELWNGNRERATTWRQPDHPIRWAWTHFDGKRAEYAARFASPEHAHLVLHRVASHRRDGDAHRIGHAGGGRDLLLVGFIVMVLIAMAVLVLSVADSARWKRDILRQREPQCVGCITRRKGAPRALDFPLVCLEGGCLVVWQRSFFHTRQVHRLCPDRDSVEIRAERSTWLVVRHAAGRIEVGVLPPSGSANPWHSEVG